MYDCDNDAVGAKDLSKHDFIGKLEFYMHQIVTQPNQTVMANLVQGDRMQESRVVIVAEEQSAGSNREQVCFVPEAKFIGGTAARIQDNLCFFIISKRLAEYIPVYKSEIKKIGSDGSYKWNQVMIGVTDLCTDDQEREIKIDFYSPDQSGFHRHLTRC